MPEYDYRCLKCKKAFSVTESMTEHESRTHRCPSCKSTRVQRVLASFSAKTSKKS